MKFGVRLEGSDYEVLFEGNKQLLGFITTRFVKAKSSNEAEQKAIKLILEDPHLNKLMVSGSKIQAAVRMTEIWQESWWKKIGGKGYSFYPMEAEKE